MIKLNPEWLRYVEDGTFRPETAALSCKNWAMVYARNQISDSIQSFEKCLDGSSISLSGLRKYKGDSACFGLISCALDEVNDFLNLKRKMNEVQKNITVQLIYKDYHYLTIYDLKHCFLNGMSGKYNPEGMFSEIDGSKIIAWLVRYADERATYAGNLANNEHENIKAGKISGDESITKLTEEQKEKNRATREKINKMFSRLEKIGFERDTEAENKKMMQVNQYDDLESYCKKKEISINDVNRLFVERCTSEWEKLELKPFDQFQPYVTYSMNKMLNYCKLNPDFDLLGYLERQKQKENENEPN